MPQLGQQRLFSQRVSQERFATAAEVVRWMGAIQAQDYGQSLWAIGARMQSPAVASVEQAIAEGDILRTWPMRGTIHWVPAEDAKWMLDLCAGRVANAQARRLQQLDLSDAVLSRCGAIFVEALSGRQYLSRGDLLQWVEEAGISTAGQRGYHVLTYHAHQGLLCIGPMQGKQQTFALLDEWATNPRDLSGDAALAELANRFFASHGPATDYDFTRWTGLTVTDSRRAIELTTVPLVTQERDGTTYWLTEEVAASPGDGDIYLLAGFDEFLLGYKDRNPVLPTEHADEIVPGNNGMFMPFIVADGVVVGIWKRKLKKKAVDFTIELFASNSRLAKKASEKASAYADFMDLPVGKIEVNL